MAFSYANTCMSNLRIYVSKSRITRFHSGQPFSLISLQYYNYNSPGTLHGNVKHKTVAQEKSSKDDSMTWAVVGVAICSFC
jgi:hypothetical protein